MTFDLNYHQIQSIDLRRDLVIPGDQEAAIQYATEHLISTLQSAIEEKDAAFIALSGGSTPKVIYQQVFAKHKSALDWSKVHLFWSDERPVAPDSPESNYRMAMDAAFFELPIPPEQIHRMEAEGEIEQKALEYEELLKETLPNGQFDLVLLGMGEDAHTASLFPKTHGLHSDGRWVIANYIPKLKTWRMTLSFPCINQAKQIVLYAFGEKKSDPLKQVLFDPYDPDLLPSQRIGTETNKALWIIDQDAATGLSLK